MVPRRQLDPLITLSRWSTSHWRNYCTLVGNGLGNILLHHSFSLNTAILASRPRSLRSWFSNHVVPNGTSSKKPTFLEVLVRQKDHRCFALPLAVKKTKARTKQNIRRAAGLERGPEKVTQMGIDGQLPRRRREVQFYGPNKTIA